MYIFVECWKARAEWLALSAGTRAAYLEELGKGIGALLQSGAEIVTWSKNDADTSSRAPFDYFAVWKFPDREQAQGFEKIVEKSGWYNYFVQVNLKGEIAAPDVCIKDMTDL